MSRCRAIYPREAHDLFGGEQLVVVGRYKKHGAAKLTITGNVAGGAQTYEFPVEFVERQQTPELHSWRNCGRRGGLARSSTSWT